MTEKKPTSTSNDSQEGCVEVLCRDGSEDLSEMTEEKKHRHRMILSRVVLKCCVEMGAKISTR
jgi:hypothetical protein